MYQAIYTLYVYIHNVYPHVIPSITDLEGIDNRDPLYGIIYCS